MKEDNIYIYTLTDPRTGSVRYVGKTNNTKNRLKLHLQNKKQNHSYINNWIKQLKRNKLKPIMEVVDTVPKNDWEFWETYWISQFKTWGFNLCNHTEGGGSTNIGKTRPTPPWNKGKKLSATIKRKMSLAHKNRDYSYMIGRIQSPETVEKRVSKMRGVLSPNAKLSAPQVSEIRNSCLTNTILAEKYNVSIRTIYKIKAREVYNDTKL